MGQCSSTSKQQRNKAEEIERFDAPADGDESPDDIVAPQLSGPRVQRRAIDEATVRDRQRKDFGLSAVRSSLDDTTCAALLALRMGRGSSVGGLLNSSASINSVDVAGPLHSGCTPRPGAKQADCPTGKPRQSGLSKPVRCSTDSNGQLEKMLDSVESGNAPKVPSIVAQG